MTMNDRTTWQDVQRKLVYMVTHAEWDDLTDAQVDALTDLAQLVAIAQIIRKDKE